MQASSASPVSNTTTPSNTTTVTKSKEQILIQSKDITSHLYVCVIVFMWCDLSQFQGYTLDLGPVDWEWLDELGTKALSSIGRQVVVMGRVRVIHIPQNDFSKPVCLCVCMWESVCAHVHTNIHVCDI